MSARTGNIFYSPSLLHRIHTGSNVEALMDGLKGRSVLLVEDEWLIALDAQEMLTELGAHVTVAASFEEGADAAMAGTFDVAVLDVNLGGQLSFPIGELLAARGTPVVYATGYNLRERPLEGFHGGQWLAKPYSKIGLERALLTAADSDHALAAEIAAARPERPNSPPNSPMNDTGRAR